MVWKEPSLREEVITDMQTWLTEEVVCQTLIPSLRKDAPISMEERMDP